MLPSDHFVRFYNEVFKFLESRNGLTEYYQEISRHQEMHCLALFQEKGLQGMYEYWEHIRIEENCDLEMKLFPDHLELKMLHCPSLSKVLDNDATSCLKYCDHCPGWIIPLLEKAGYVCEYYLEGRQNTHCRMLIYPDSSGKKSQVFD